MVMEPQYAELQRLVSENARANHRLAAWVKGLATLSGLTMLCLIWTLAQFPVHAQSNSKDDVLTARGLVIVDAHGKTRVRIGAPLPEPIIMGKVHKRDDSISGILIYDALGNERGGYVTDNSVGNAFITLDSNIGQEATLVAYPKGGAQFMVNDDAKDEVVLSGMKSGPTIQLYRAGKKLFQAPPAPESK